MQRDISDPKQLTARPAGIATYTVLLFLISQPGFVRVSSLNNKPPASPGTSNNAREIVTESEERPPSNMTQHKNVVPASVP